MSVSTDLAIRKWAPRKDGEAIAVTGRLGLYVRGWRTGAKAFYFRTDTWLKMRDYPVLTLAEARELAIVARRLHKAGYSNEALSKGFAVAKTAPELEEIAKTATAQPASWRPKTTYDELFEEWFAEISPTLQAGPSRRRPQAIHELHVSPRIGRRPIAEIRRPEVFNLLSDLFRDKPVTAGHALGHISKVFERAINLEIREDSPVPPRSAFPRRAKKPKHHGTLAPERLPELWQWLQDRQAGMATRLAILTVICTGHRIGVVVSARWEHIDEATGVWTIPERLDKSSRGLMKSGRSFSQKLPELLLRDLIAQRDGESSSNWVFQSPTRGGHLTPNAVLKILKTFDIKLTTHGFRNAIKVWCRQASPPVPEHIADAFCDHSLKGLDAAYRRMDTFAERAALAKRLYDFVTAESLDRN